MHPHRITRVVLAFIALALLSPGGQGNCLDETGAKTVENQFVSWPPPISAQAARTWIALHETTIKPLPDRTPLREVLRALREATRGKGKNGEGIDFRLEPVALLEAEITPDEPVALPFVGQPEVSVDTYLKYLLHQFAWERYVREGSVVIDSPCDDCEGYATVGDAEAHTWLLLHQVAPLRFPEKTSLGGVLEAIEGATKGEGLNGRGLVIGVAPLARKKPGQLWRTPVTIVAEGAPIGASLAQLLKSLQLAFRVLPDGNVLIVAAPGPDVVDPIDWISDFPQYRFTYSFVWRQ
jgi:hypothetical protein